MNKIKALKNMLCVHFQKSDVKRWMQDKNLNDSWDDRTRLIAQMIKNGESVIDFGAGKMRLRTFIPADCRYTPVDIVAREEGMIAADLNKLPLPPLGTFDVSVFSGVLEYLHDAPALIQAIQDVAPRIIVSYMVLENLPKVIRRRSLGFSNDYTEEQFRALFEKFGFKQVGRSKWKQHVIFDFQRVID
jgi:hypothetical protein